MSISSIKKNAECIVLCLFAILLQCCTDFLEIEPPRTEIRSSAIFIDDATAEAAVIELYNSMAAPSSYAAAGVPGFCFVGELSSDILIYNNNGLLEFFKPFNDNEIMPANPQLGNLWSELYAIIYKANAVLEGLGSTSSLSQSLKNRLEGESRFIRAFQYFYLVNLFGDVPLVLTTDYRVNKSVTRTPSDEVYKQIVADLKAAQNLLPLDYSEFDNLRMRASKGVATALLARTYLYLEDWANAELEATSLIDDSLYSLETDLTAVFRRTSVEPIFQLWRSASSLYSQESIIYYNSRYAKFSQSFLNSFENNDKRFTTWVRQFGADFTPQKYKLANSSQEDYSTVLRLAEQYLIRAEARAHRGIDLSEAIADLDKIRERAGLSLIQDINPGINQSELLVAIEQERKIELFTEWGHRWLDLKRTNRANEVLKSVKGLTWQPADVLYPIPEAQILNDPAMRDAQNPGY